MLLALVLVALLRGGGAEDEPLWESQPSGALAFAGAPAGGAATLGRLLPRAERPRPKPLSEPFWRVIGAGGEEFALFVEASALLHTAAGQALLPCLGFGEGGPLRQRFAEALGLDLERDVDRLGLTDGAVVLSGHFGELAERLRGADDTQPCGTRGLCSPPASDGSRLLLWGEELLTRADGPEQLAALLGRLEGPASADSAPVPDVEGLGDVHLRAGAAQLPSVLGEAGEQLKGLADLIPELREASLGMDFDDGLGTVVRLAPRDPARASAIAERLRQAVREARGILPPELAVVDRDIAKVLAGVEVEVASGEVKVRARLPASHLAKRLAGCRLGAEPPPEGYQRLPEAPVPGFGLAPPPGFVDPRENKLRLLRDWPQAAPIFVLLDTTSSQTWVEPRSFLTLSLSSRYVPGSCERAARLGELLARDPNTEVAHVEIAGRSWLRTLETFGEVRSLDLSTCEADCRWSLRVTLPRAMPVGVAQLSFEDYLRGAHLECPGAPAE